jgi:ubiquinone/menaquinone biosynthesis C-methylase UbiE
MDTATQRPAPRLRSDYRKIASLYGDKRSSERITVHYQLERRLSDTMRGSTREQREAGLYGELYDELIGSLEDHPRKAVNAGEEPAHPEGYIVRQAAMVIREVDANDVFLDIGGGDCRLALAVAPHVAKTIVVDVSDALVPTDHGVRNFEFVKTRGVDIPLPTESVSFIYSNQVMEHLHPEDAIAQLRELYRVLKPGGRYLLRTPNRVTGPHDVSKYFDDVARGTHMKEYTYASLSEVLRDAGFTHPTIIIAPRAYRFCTMPRTVALILEAIFSAVPRSLHTYVCRSRVGRTLLGITMMVEKPKHH